MRAWLTLVLSLLACGRTQLVTAAIPSLTLTARPQSIDTLGEKTTLRVTAQASSTVVGSGTVRLTSSAGSLREGVTLELKDGAATTEFFCNARLDRSCVGSADINATWMLRTGPVEAKVAIELISAAADAGHELCPGGREVPTDAGPIIRQCAPRSSDECAGTVDAFLRSVGTPMARLNADQGNGFDDDCDGFVDEGCACPAAGLTKPCFVVPVTQVGSNGTPVGWCAQNAKGTVDCSNRSTWTGVCRGGSAPAETDACDPGDFDCDGLEANSRCKCTNVSLRCPTEPLVLQPFPDPARLTIVDGNSWLPDDATRAAATNWRWTAVGGDCDNLLPHPTFALYRVSNSLIPESRVGRDQGFRLDTSTSPPRLVASPGAPLRGVVAQRGDGLFGASIAPAFGLSGDYLLQGEFEIEGRTFACTQKVQVRAPGIRAELCWDEVPGSVDVDLHVARLQDVTWPVNGWDETAEGGSQDCNYKDVEPFWGYRRSSASACNGWSARGAPTGDDAGCNNPRLDQDNVACDENETDPTSAQFCGPENINLDVPRDGDRFVIGANYFSGTRTVQVHANVYCNGERVASMGANPVTGATFPKLVTAGSDRTGDFWTAAVVTAHVSDGQLTSCTVQPIPSHGADGLRDGSESVCVDSTENDLFPYATHQFVEAQTRQTSRPGSIPPEPSEWCKH